MIDLSSMASGYEMNEMRCVPTSSHASHPRRHFTTTILEHNLEMTSFSLLFILLILFNSLKSKQWKLNVYKLQSIAETTEKIIQRCQEFPPVCRFLCWPNLVRHHTFVAELPLNGRWYLCNTNFIWFSYPGLEVPSNMQRFLSLQKPKISSLAFVSTWHFTFII